MYKYPIFVSEQFLDTIKKYFAGHFFRIYAKLKAYVYLQLREDPHFGQNIKKLKNYHPDTWRYRIGKYRFYYAIDEKEHLVIMLAIDARKELY
ncbi:MAG TPA: type II toxin-antitoxin system RelE/ParE family toxin [Dissulfurispiraceae bacterium]|nr:type II toxin-antitoxin system RelE/ParE family toxin [Dissulfurispiraceae bacterium]